MVWFLNFIFKMFQCNFIYVMIKEKIRNGIMNMQTGHFYLYKFFEKEEYRNQFMNGMLFCNTAQWFVNAEKQSAGVVDTFENAKIISIADDNHLVQHELVNCLDGSAKVIFRKYKEKPNNYRKNQAFISYNTEKYNIFCMSTIWTDDNSIVTEFDKNNANNFGEYGILIFNVPKFEYLIYKSSYLNPTIKECCGKPVNYVPFEKRENVQRWDIWHKFDYYKSQQEFRLVFNNSKNEVLRYKLAQDLSCIAAIIPNKKVFYDNIIIGKDLFSTIKVLKKD